MPSPTRTPSRPGVSIPTRTPSPPAGSTVTRTPSRPGQGARRLTSSLNEAVRSVKPTRSRKGRTSTRATCSALAMEAAAGPWTFAPIQSRWPRYPRRDWRDRRLPAGKVRTTRCVRATASSADRVRAGSSPRAASTRPTLPSGRRATGGAAERRREITATAGFASTCFSGESPTPTRPTSTRSRRGVDWRATTRSRRGEHRVRRGRWTREMRR
mmetsp:Transcript_3515/g.9400  ORF Transcript_3515/g.9400 Transcript_3515/m.9400 type:complete len:213 (-) Transcript_3515:159-797(-)